MSAMTKLSRPEIRHGDALKALSDMGSDTVDLIVTSPSYAD